MDYLFIALLLLFVVDVWSVGCIMAELLTSKTLFPGNDHILFLLFYKKGSASVTQLYYLKKIKLKDVFL